MEKLAYNTREAAEALGISKRTLEKYRANNVGPSYCKRGKIVIYSATELQRWMEKHRVDVHAP